MVIVTWSFREFCFCVARCEASATRAWQADNPAAGVRAADLSLLNYLETEADIIQSGKRARIS